ncbi:MAG: peptidylprolyl isomerase [Candidatus Thiodiazotropha sp. (ex Epidulcina cf. delphinae)]|nr:peptidylprolyl isomerase [Candidatus Thiodiazotropha sp. (ex Epidulcina cf. delphinae)]
MKYLKSILRNDHVVIRPSVFFGFVCIVTGSLFLSVTSSGAGTLEAGNKNEALDIVAKVNGIPITMDELAPQVDKNLRKSVKYGMRRPNDDFVKRLRRDALDKLIVVELFYQEAKGIEIANLESRIVEKIEELKEQAADNDKDFDPNQANRALRKKILIDEYMALNDLKDPEISEKALQDYYEANKQNFIRKENARTRHILVEVAADAEPDKKAAARKKIEEVRKLLLDGKPFGEVAIEYSECNSASGGGELGYNERGYMPPLYDKVAFSQEIGELSEIIGTEHGFHIVEVVDRKPAGVVPYDDIRDFIGKYLNNRHAKKKLAAHVKGLKEKAKLEIYL